MKSKLHINKNSPIEKHLPIGCKSKIYSKAFFSFLKSRLITRKPFFLAHSITYACDSRCKTCTQWQMSKMANKDLSTEKVFELLTNAYNAGMRSYYVFGGEPLLRKDIEKILEFAKERGFLTTMNTNASLLEKKAESISDFLDFIFVSLDSPDEHHDFIRGRKGSFKEAMNGIKKILELGKTKVTIVSTISKLNFDKIENLARFAQKLGVGISYNAVEPTLITSYEDDRTNSVVEDYGLSEEELQIFYSKLLELKLEGYPLMETESVLRDYAKRKRFVCNFPKIFVYVSPDGMIFPCTYKFGHPIVNLNRISFEDYFSSSCFKNHIKQSENCDICVRTCLRMYSYTYALNPLHYLNLISSMKILKEQEFLPKIIGFNPSR